MKFISETKCVGSKAVNILKNKDLDLCINQLTEYILANPVSNCNSGRMFHDAKTGDCGCCNDGATYAEASNKAKLYSFKLAYVTEEVEIGGTA